MQQNKNYFNHKTMSIQGTQSSLMHLLPEEIGVEAFIEGW